MAGTSMPRERSAWRIGAVVVALVGAGIPAQAQPAELKLGVFLPWNPRTLLMGPFISPAVPLAVNAINARDDLLPDTNLTWVFYDPDWCSNSGAVEATMDMKINYDVDVFVGPPCSETAMAAAPVAKYWNIPIVSWFAGSPALSDKQTFPNFARVDASFGGVLVLLQEMAHEIGWDRLALVYNDREISVSIANDLETRLASDDRLSIGYRHLFTEMVPATANATMAWMPRLKESGMRIVLVVADCEDTRSVMLAASRLDMLEGYQYFFLEHEEIEECHIVTVGDTSAAPDGWGPEADGEAARAFNNTLIARPYDFDSPASRAFTGSLLAEFNADSFEPYRSPPYGTITPMAANSLVSPGFVYGNSAGAPFPPFVFGLANNLYDAIFLYAHAADAVIRSGGDPVAEPDAILGTLAQVNFTGVTGFTALDANLDRNPTLVLEQIRRVSDAELSATRVGLYAAETRAYTTDPDATILYPGGSSTPPTAFVLRECTLADYDFYEEAECDANLRLQTRYVLKGGVECQDIDPTGSVDCSYVPVESAVGKSVLVLASFAALVALCVAIWVVLYRTETLVKYAQPEFCLLFLAGCFLLNASVILRVGQSIALTCVASPWVFHLSFTLCFSALLAKIYRVWRLFFNEKLERRTVKASNVVQICGALLAIDVAILIAVTVEGKFTDTTPDAASAGGESTECTNGGIMRYLLWGLKVLVMLATCSLAWQVRELDEAFAESRHIMIAAYQATVLCAIAAMVTLTSESVAVLIQAFAVAVATTGAVVAIFAPKMGAVYGYGDAKEPDIRSGRPSHASMSNVSGMRGSAASRSGQIMSRAKSRKSNVDRRSGKAASDPASRDRASSSMGGPQASTPRRASGADTPPEAASSSAATVLAGRTSDLGGRPSSPTRIHSEIEHAISDAEDTKEEV